MTPRTLPRSKALDARALAMIAPALAQLGQRHHLRPALLQVALPGAEAMASSGAQLCSTPATATGGAALALVPVLKDVQAKTCLSIADVSALVGLALKDAR